MRGRQGEEAVSKMATMTAKQFCAEVDGHLLASLPKLQAINARHHEHSMATMTAKQFCAEVDGHLLASLPKLQAINARHHEHSLKVMMVNEKHLLITVEDPHKFGHFSAAVDPIGLPATTVQSSMQGRRVQIELQHRTYVCARTGARRHATHITSTIVGVVLDLARRLLHYIVHALL
ncbi:uncharacterized protein [Dermacentor albipictus]|uniref:uncharacterized protein isoform X2 n=1 Tax=Dermacentor albipictus TaxID=60249 RepID=UPI0038FD3BA6